MVEKYKEGELVDCARTKMLLKITVLLACLATAFVGSVPVSTADPKSADIFTQVLTNIQEKVKEIHDAVSKEITQFINNSEFASALSQYFEDYSTILDSIAAIRQSRVVVQNYRQLLNYPEFTKHYIKFFADYRRLKEFLGNDSQEQGNKFQNVKQHTKSSAASQQFETNSQIYSTITVSNTEEQQTSDISNSQQSSNVNPELIEATDPVTNQNPTNIIIQILEDLNDKIEEISEAVYEEVNSFINNSEFINTLSQFVENYVETFNNSNIIKQTRNVYNYRQLANYPEFVQPYYNFLKNYGTLKQYLEQNHLIRDPNSYVTINGGNGNFAQFSHQQLASDKGWLSFIQSLFSGQSQQQTAVNNNQQQSTLTTNLNNQIASTNSNEEQQSAINTNQELGNNANDFNQQQISTSNGLNQQQQIYIQQTIDDSQQFQGVAQIYSDQHLEEGSLAQLGANQDQQILETLVDQGVAETGSTVDQQVTEGSPIQTQEIVESLISQNEQTSTTNNEQIINSSNSQQEQTAGTNQEQQLEQFTGNQQETADASNINQQSFADLNNQQIDELITTLQNQSDKDEQVVNTVSASQESTVTTQHQQSEQSSQNVVDQQSTQTATQQSEDTQVTDNQNQQEFGGTQHVDDNLNDLLALIEDSQQTSEIQNQQKTYVDSQVANQQLFEYAEQLFNEWLSTMNVSTDLVPFHDDLLSTFDFSTPKHLYNELIGKGTYFDGEYLNSLIYKVDQNGVNVVEQTQVTPVVNGNLPNKKYIKKIEYLVKKN